MNPGLRRVQIWCFSILLVSYAFFWQARDWNASTRLMLTYALMDRGTLQLDGLQIHTGDIAHFRGHYYIDKLPGFSALATIPYGLAKVIFRLPGHPLDHADDETLQARIVGLRIRKCLDVFVSHKTRSLQRFAAD